jgi:DNA modification methylase
VQQGHEGDVSESLLSGRVHLYCGDCCEVVATLPENSLDACVTDPPYHLISIGERFGKPDSKPPNSADNLHQQYNRLSRGFMGKVWDGGDVAFDPATWRAVFRVLKPGAHLLAMGGTRTFHRLACAIEDAGFEIRDTISWLYGSGFPKSHDVSKGIDRLDAVQMRRDRQLRFTAWMRSTGLTTARIDEITRTNMGGHYTSAASQPAVATRDLFEMLRPHFQCDVPAWIEQLVDERTVESENFKRRALLRFVNGTRLAVAPGQNESRDELVLSITEPATDAARQWEGWGTALKPAMELIVLARKPLSEGTVAANVLRWGTGAINVDGCRVGTDEVKEQTAVRNGGIWESEGQNSNRHNGSGTNHTLGRWPANVVHDGSEEVLAGFPDVGKSPPVGSMGGGSNSHNIFGDFAGERHENGYGDSGSAARFFYTSKADSDDRLGSKHPTVKPLDLMQWLVRLVTPPRGCVLDPFAGTGTTGEAAWREGMSAILIEAEAEYQADIRRRMGLALAGPDERVRESIKAKGLPRDDGPLFAWREAAE